MFPDDLAALLELEVELCSRQDELYDLQFRYATPNMHRIAQLQEEIADIHDKIAGLKGLA